MHEMSVHEAERDNAMADAVVARPAAGDVVPSPGSDADRSARRAQFEKEALVHLDALYSFALKLTRSRDHAEDLVSETILRAFDRWEQYRLGTNIRAWMFTILYHAFVSRKRRIDVHEVPLPEDLNGWSAYETVGEADPEGRFYDSFVDEEVTRAIDALPQDYRAAVVLSDVHGLRYAEIAEILGIPEGTVKSRLFRGRRILQRALVGYATEMGYIKPRPASSSAARADAATAASSDSGTAAPSAAHLS
ncbi:MAG TPA: sigma-70 family RNA polymerase sigma factor [Gemmatimonadaceae bacterium]|nr:sigma-70 family RNA polymerase sigma factor [Gemmatimonadaceae bacterium]